MPHKFNGFCVSMIAMQTQCEYNQYKKGWSIAMQPHSV